MLRAGGMNFYLRSPQIASRFVYDLDKVVNAESKWAEYKKQLKIGITISLLGIDATADKIDLFIQEGFVKRVNGGNAGDQLEHYTRQILNSQNFYGQYIAEIEKQKREGFQKGSEFRDKDPRLTFSSVKDIISSESFDKTTQDSGKTYRFTQKSLDDLRSYFTQTPTINGNLLESAFSCEREYDVLICKHTHFNDSNGHPLEIILVDSSHPIKHPRMNRFTDVNDDQATAPDQEQPERPDECPDKMPLGQFKIKNINGVNTPYFVHSHDGEIYLLGVVDASMDSFEQLQLFMAQNVELAYTRESDDSAVIYAVYEALGLSILFEDVTNKGVFEEELENEQQRLAQAQAAAEREAEEAARVAAQELAGLRATLSNLVEQARPLLPHSGANGEIILEEATEYANGGSSADADEVSVAINMVREQIATARPLAERAEQVRQQREEAQHLQRERYEMEQILAQMNALREYFDDGHLNAYNTLIGFMQQNNRHQITQNLPEMRNRLHMLNEQEAQAHHTLLKEHVPNQVFTLVQAISPEEADMSLVNLHRMWNNAAQKEILLNNIKSKSYEELLALTQTLNEVNTNDVATMINAAQALEH